MEMKAGVAGGQATKRLLLYLTVCFLWSQLARQGCAQPHPFPMSFTITAVSHCKPASRMDGAGAELADATVNDSMCHMRSFNVCMELMYYPEKCMSRVVSTPVKGDCGQQGDYGNSTVVSLTPGNDDLPQTEWVVNFNSSNPMLPPVGKDGIHCQSDWCSVLIPTWRPPHARQDGGDAGVVRSDSCETNITVQAYGWYVGQGREERSEMPAGALECDEEKAMAHCEAAYP